jgi:hypothetical protein
MEVTMLLSQQTTALVIKQIVEDYKAYLTTLECDLTSEDIEDLFVKPEDKETMRKAFDLYISAGSSVCRSIGDVPGISAQVNVTGFLPPLYMVASEANKDSPAYDKFDMWRETAQGVKDDFCNYLMSFLYINSTADEMRVFNSLLPCLAETMREDADRYICGNYIAAGRTMSELRRFQKLVLSGKGPRNLPGYEKEVFVACKQANALGLRLGMIRGAKASKRRSVIEVAGLSVMLPTFWATKYRWGVSLDLQNDLPYSDKLYLSPNPAE